MQGEQGECSDHGRFNVRGTVSGFIPHDVNYGGLCLPQCKNAVSNADGQGLLPGKGVGNDGYFFSPEKTHFHETGVEECWMMRIGPCQSHYGGAFAFFQLRQTAELPGLSWGGKCHFILRLDALVLFRVALARICRNADD